MNSQEKLELITSGLQEVLKFSILEDVIVKEGRNLKIYWGKNLSPSSFLYRYINTAIPRHRPNRSAPTFHSPISTS